MQAPLELADESSLTYVTVMRRLLVKSLAETRHFLQWFQLNFVALQEAVDSVNGRKVNILAPLLHVAGVEGID